MQSLLEAKGLEHVINLVGGQNRYQYQVVFLVGLQLFFRAAWAIYYPFLNQPPDFVCRDPITGLTSICTELTGGCDEKIIAPGSPNSLAIDLGLYCELAYVRTLASTLLFLGGNLGAAYWSYLSDHSGRKTALRYSHLVASTFVLLFGTISSGPTTFMILAMLVWTNYSCVCSLSCTYITEFTSASFSKTAVLLVLLCTCAGQAFIVFVAIFVSDWRIVYVVFLAVPSILTSITFQFLDETPAYHLGRKEFAQVATIVRKMGETNNITASLPIESPSQNTQQGGTVKESAKGHVEEKAKSWNYLEILTHSKLRVRLMSFGVLKFYLNMSFYGSIFALSTLGGSIYTNSFIAIIGETLGYVVAFRIGAVSTKRIVIGGLKTVVISGTAFLLIPSISCESVFICQDVFLQGLLALILRTASCLVLSGSYNLGTELFPAEVRSQCTGIGEICCAMGAVLAPSIIVMAQMNGLSPLFVFGMLGFFPLLAANYIPEEQLKCLEEEKKDVEMSVYVKMSDNDTE